MREEKVRAGGKGVCGRLMSPAHETQSMREIRLFRGRLPRKGGGLTGMIILPQVPTSKFSQFFQALFMTKIHTTVIR